MTFPARLALRRRHARIRRRMSIRELTRDLGPHLMRDIGFDPWPQEPPVGLPPRW